MSLGDVDLNLLYILDTLLTERNVTRASGRLNLSQSATSRALGRLRKLFDDPLLVRVGREMHRTPLAEQLVPQVREILDLAARAIHDRTNFEPRTDSSEFSVSCSDYVTLVLMCRVVEVLTIEAPNVRLHLVPRQADAGPILRRNEVDLVIEPRALMESAGLSERALFDDRWRCAVWSGSSLAVGAMTKERFAAAPYLTYTLGTSRVPNLADLLLQDKGFGREPVVTTENFALVPFLLRGTEMVSLVLERGVTAFGDGAEVDLRKSPVPLPKLVETMYWNPRTDSDPAHCWLRSIVERVARSL